MANQNSLYVQSLVDFILDTKPYHSKLTEIVEEYQFFDTVNVKIAEKLLIKTKISSAYTYNYFSAANPTYRSFPAHRVMHPELIRREYIVGADENKDLALVPYVYSQKSFDGPGINQVFVKRASGMEAQVESVDYFQSHGSMQFQIKRVNNAAGVLDPAWATTVDGGVGSYLGVVGAATAATIALSLDTTNPNSAVNQIKAIITGIQNQVTAAGGDIDVQAALDALFAILATPALPSSYIDLFGNLGASSKPALIALVSETDANGRTLDEQLSRLSSSLYFQKYSDMGEYESGLLSYNTTTNGYITASSIVGNPQTDYEEWTLTLVDPTSLTYSVSGSTSGLIGYTIIGTTFSTNRISFTTALVAAPPVGDTLALTPVNQLVVGVNAPLETWNIIKVNPIAHDRPVFLSSRYGNISDVNGKMGLITILDPALSTGDLILTAQAGGTHFSLTSTAEPSYTGTATVGTPFNDGRIAFTLSGTFQQNDKFYIGIQNLPAQVQNLDLGYGYDLDPYDNDAVTYGPGYRDGQPVGFYYDGRFTDYDLTQLGLTLDENTVSGRGWRLRALPNSATPVATIKKDGSGPSSYIDLTDPTSGTAPDPALASVPVYSMAGDSNSAPDLQLFYSTSFSVEYSDDGFNTVTQIGTANVGTQFDSTTFGIHFKIAQASRPFVSVKTDDGVQGGDIFSFNIVNAFPTLTEQPIGLVAPYLPRLVMHSDSFYPAPEAKWTITFTSANHYVLTNDQGVSVESDIATAGVNANEGLSLHTNGVHFTIEPGNGVSTGDVFTFNTFASKPSYLVHGSVTGFTAPATVGKYYWNGYIGFKLAAPIGTTFVSGTRIDPATIGLSYTLREDCPTLTYTFTQTTAGFMVTRSDIGVTGFALATGTFKDTYLSATLAGVNSNFQIQVQDHGYPLWNTADLVILNPGIKSRLPATGESIVVEKAEFGSISLSITPGLTDLSPLSPITIDQRFTATDTNGDTALSATSPETAVLDGWLPMVSTALDSLTSLAIFSDAATRFVQTSASSGETIGALEQTTTDINEPIQFTWDEAFFNKYLPLNTEVNLVTYNPGFNEKTRVRISESIKFLIDGGPLAEDWMFQDTANVHVGEDLQWNIISQLNDAFAASVKDGPFIGYAAGYDTLAYDQETGTAGAYDTGYPQDINSLLMNPSMTAQQKQDVVDLWNNYVSDNGVPTTQAEFNYFLAQVAADPATGAGLIGNNGGIPIVGLSWDIKDSQMGSLGASIQEALVMMAIDSANGYDSQGYDLGGVDVEGDSTAIMYSGSVPPVPPSVPAGTTYDSLDTPLESATPARIFQVSFATPVTTTPVISIWLPNNAAPYQVPVVQRLSASSFQVSLPAASPAKLILG